MATALQFSELINSIYSICDNPIPKNLFARYRCEYEDILSQVCLGQHQNVETNVSYLFEHTGLGSQPTMLKRLKELQQLKLLRQKEHADKRLKSFELTELGEGYLERCSELVLSVAKGIHQVTKSNALGWILAIFLTSSHFAI